LWRNRIGDAGAIALAESLIGHPTIIHFEIWGNKGITDKSVPVLKEILRSSKIISMGFKFGGTSISYEAQEELDNLLELPVEERARMQEDEPDEKCGEKRMKEEETERSKKKKKKKKNEDESERKKTTKTKSVEKKGKITPKKGKTSETKSKKNGL